MNDENNQMNNISSLFTKQGVETLIDSVINLGKKLESAFLVIEKECQKLATVDYDLMANRLIDVFVSIGYYDVLDNIKWPLYLITDTKFQEELIQAYSNDSKDTETIKSLVFAYCTDEKILKCKKVWENCTAIKEDRKPILDEAIEMYINGYYYSCTSLLMCQLYGIASDIVDISKKYNIQLSEEDKNEIAEYYGIEKDQIDKEKGKLIQMTFVVDNKIMIWSGVANYLKSDILSSSESKKRWASQPLRNKICHGDQLNFGTKEHALKSVLIIDLLVKLACEIERVGKIGEKYGR